MVLPTSEEALEDPVVVDDRSAPAAAFLRVAREKIAWFYGLLAFFLVISMLIYSLSSDKFLTIALVTSKTSEDRGFDVGSLGGLAALAGGGQRPTFEQLGVLVQSSAVIRQALSQLKRDNPRFVASLLKRSRVQQIRFDFEQGARKLFGRPPIMTTDKERMVDALRGSLKINKTPEGYLGISTVSGTDEGQVSFIRSVLSEADSVIRVRENRDYKTRVSNYQVLLESQARPTERAILVSLIGREYSKYVSAQSGETFSFEYLEPITEPKRVYSAGLLTLLITATLLSILTFLTFIALFMRRRNN